MSDPEIARIDPVNYRHLLSEINFNDAKFLHTVSKSPDTRRIRIDQILDYCDSGEWVIPKFQRYFDWRKEDVHDFLKSIFLNYYVGALLLWDVRREQELDVMAIYGVDNKTNLIKNSIILDGQQRITSLYYAIKSSDYSLSGDNKKKSFFYIDFYEFFTSNNTENLINQNSKNKLIEPHYLPYSSPCAQTKNNPIVISPGIFFYWISYLFVLICFYFIVYLFGTDTQIFLLEALLSRIEYENKKRICIVNKIIFYH